jgi:hypothetical protein
LLSPHEQAKSSTAEPASSVQQPEISTAAPVTEPTTQLPVSDRVSSASTSLPAQLRNQAYDELERDERRLSSAPETVAGTEKGETAQASLIASSPAKRQRQSGDREDGSRTPGCNPPNGASDTAQSLWDRAYDVLRTMDPRLVKKYEKLLSREMPKASAYFVDRRAYVAAADRAQVPI